MRSIVIILGLFCLSPTLLLAGQDLVKAPPAFSSGGKTAIPVDFSYVTLEIEFDAAAKTGKAKSKIEFYASQEGYPLFDMAPNATAVRLNNQQLGSNALVEVRDPDRQTYLRMVDSKVPAFSNNLLEIEYDFPSSKVTYTNGGVRVGFWMGDVNASQQRGFDIPHPNPLPGHHQHHQKY